MATERKLSEPPIRYDLMEAATQTVREVGVTSLTTGWGSQKWPGESLRQMYG